MFLRLPENAFINRDKTTAQAWASMMQHAVNEAAESGTPLTSDWDILEAGAKKLRELMGITAGAGAATTSKPEPKPGEQKPNRDPKLETVPATLGSAPSAGTIGTKSTADELAGKGIEDIEAYMARQDEGSRDALLRSVPGAFTDG
jgi:hypothetical protein